MKPAVFLDRDNTLIVNDGDLGDPAQVKLIQGAASAIASLRGLGFTIVVVSNQGGVARGRFGESDVDAVNKRLNELIESTTRASVDRFYYCPYHPDGSIEQYRKEHPWRKPQPGMLLQAQKDMDLDLTRSWMIGDQVRDVQAGRAAGVRTILLHGDAEKAVPGNEADLDALRSGNDDGERVIPTYVAPSLAEAVKVVAQMPRPERAMDMTGAASVGNRQHFGTSSRATPPATPPQDGPPDADCKATAVRSVDTRPRRVVMASAVEVEAPPPPQVEATEIPATTQAPVEQPPLEQTEVVSDPPIDDPTEPNNDQVAVTLQDPKNPVEESVDQPPQVDPPRDRQEAPLRTVIQQILQELRNQRQVDADFSYISVVAIVLQMIAVMCLLAAWFLGTNDLEQFLRWTMVAMVVQLGTIAALMFRK